MAKRFFIYGFVGTLLETLWTGLNSMLEGDHMLITHTSLWMIIIYGLMAFNEPVFRTLANKPLLIRGTAYTLLIFSAEYLSGHILRIFNACPWDYSAAALSINGLVKPSYAPLWFGAGILYEKLFFILSRQNRRHPSKTGA